MNYAEMLLSEISFSAVRSRGPGGQNVNKVSSAAILKWDFLQSNLVSDEQKEKIQSRLAGYINKENIFSVRSDESRDLEQNKKRCLEKLNLLLTKAFFVPKIRRPTKPTRGSKLRKQEKKTQRSTIKKLRGKVEY